MTGRHGRAEPRNRPADFSREAAAMNVRTVLKASSPLGSPTQAVSDKLPSIRRSVTGELPHRRTLRSQGNVAPPALPCSRLLHLSW
jgi:hypothetical protein